MSAKPSDVVLGVLTVHLPDASSADHWFRHDLAGAFGVETHAEAENALRATLGASSRGVHVDSEAGAVVVRTRGAAGMIRVLAALGSLAVRPPLWMPDELHRAIGAMRAWRRLRRSAYDVGAIVGVPLRDGSLGAAHVVAFEDGGSVRGPPLVVPLDLRSSTREELAVAIARGDGIPVGARVIMDSEILTGEWPLIGARTVGVDAEALLGREKGASASGGVMAWFLDAYHGLRLWDGLADPRLHEMVLLPSVPLPSTRRYLREVFEQRLVAAFGTIPDPVVTGPAVLDVHIAYPGNGLPRLIDLPRSRQLADRVKRDVPGSSVVLTGGGRGFLDVFATTTDAAVALRAVEAAARDLGIHRVTMVEAFPAVALEGLKES